MQGQIELKLGEELMETLLKVKFLILIGLNKLDLKKLEIMFKSSRKYQRYKYILRKEPVQIDSYFN